MNENKEVSKEIESEENVRKEWITPEIKVLPVPNRTNAGAFNTSMLPEQPSYTPS